MSRQRNEGWPEHVMPLDGQWWLTDRPVVSNNRESSMTSSRAEIQCPARILKEVCRYY